MGRKEVRSKINNMHMGFSSSQKGVALYLALAILAILLAIALGVAAIVIGQQQTLNMVGYSVVALYAADSGVERELYDRTYQGGVGAYSIFFDLDGDGTGIDKVDICPDKLVAISERKDACAYIEILSVAPLRIRSVGYYPEVNRALQIEF
jgi:hypothetical protein